MSIFVAGIGILIGKVVVVDDFIGYAIMIVVSTE
jgi:hypothetical protein